MGCMPTLDTNVKKAIGATEGLRRWPNYSTDQKSRTETLGKFWDFYRVYECHLQKAVNCCEANKFHYIYPPMKLLDMFLWKKGAEIKS